MHVVWKCGLHSDQCKAVVRTWCSVAPRDCCLASSLRNSSRWPQPGFVFSNVIPLAGWFTRSAETSIIKRLIVRYVRTCWGNVKARSCELLPACLPWPFRTGCCASEALGSLRATVGQENRLFFVGEEALLLYTLPRTLIQGKCKVHPRTGHESPEESRGIALLFL